ncbi:MAG: WD40 repeat domain-containing protein [bacterium]|nr:WD40 repeat domain-containing protein [bacterium]
MSGIKKFLIVLFVAACVSIGVIYFFLFKEDVEYYKVNLPESFKFNDFNPNTAADWDRLSDKAMLARSRGMAMLTRLKALCLDDNEERRQCLAHLINEDWSLWEKTFYGNNVPLAVLYNQKGDRVLIGNRLYNPANPTKELMKLNEKEIGTADFSRDDRLLLTGNLSAIKKVCLWDGKTGKPIGKPVELNSKVRALAFNHDGSRFFTCSEKKLRFWTTSNREEYRKPVGFDFPIKTAVFNEDGSLLFVCSSFLDKGYFIDTKTGTRFGKPIEKSVDYAAAFSKDSRFLYFIGSGALNRFEIVGGRLEDVGSLFDPHFFELDSPNRRLAIYDGYNLLKLFDLESDRLVGWFNFSDGYGIPPGSVLRFSPDGNHLLIGRRGAAAYFRMEENILEGEIIEHPGYVSHIGAYNKGDVILAHTEGMIYLWNANDGTLLDTKATNNIDGKIMAVSPDGSVVFFATNNCDTPNKCQFWNIQTGEPIGKPFFLNDSIRYVVFRSRDNTVITYSYKEVIRFLSVNTGKEVKKPIHLKGARSFLLSPTQEDVVVITASKHEMETDALRVVRNEPGERIFATSCVAYNCNFDPTGRMFIAETGDADNRFLLWDLKTGKKINVSNKSSYLFKSSFYRDVFFTPDGKGVILVGMSNWIHRFDISSGEFKPVASRLIPGNWNRLIKFTDETGDSLKALLKLSGESYRIVTIRFDKYDAPPLHGKPEQLLRDWEARFASRVFDDGNLGVMLEK